MAEEIENYLLEKLTNAVEEEAKSTDQNRLPKLLPFPSQFRVMKDLLANKASPYSAIAAEDWPRVRRENLYYVNNLLSDWQMISKKHSSYFPAAQVCAYNNLRKSLKNIMKDLKGGENSGTNRPENNENASSTNKSETYRWSYRHVDPNKIHGLEEKAMTMERQLVRRDPDAPFKAMGFVGMAGIGKTTLCQLIFNRKNVKQHFLPRIWVCISKQPNDDADNKKEIVKRILRCLGVEEEIIHNADINHGLRGLIFALRLQLMGKKYLIVLDDVWTMDNFLDKLESRSNLNDNWGEELSYGLPKGCGGTVIMTSRSEEIAKKMVGEENIHSLAPLTDENCWSIFKGTVVEDENQVPPYLDDLKDEIQKKCAGLPLAAKLLGQIVQEQIQERSAAIENRQNENGQSQQPTS